jgi:hypothetical protein
MELLIATSLALANAANEPNSTSVFPNIPSISSNNVSLHLRNYFQRNVKNILVQSEVAGFQTSLDCVTVVVSVLFSR